MGPCWWEACCGEDQHQVTELQEAVLAAGHTQVLGYVSQHLGQRNLGAVRLPLHAGGTKGVPFGFSKTLAGLKGQ